MDYRYILGLTLGEPNHRFSAFSPNPRNPVVLLTPSQCWPWGIEPKGREGGRATHFCFQVPGYLGSVQGHGHAAGGLVEGSRAQWQSELPTGVVVCSVSSWAGIEPSIAWWAGGRCSVHLYLGPLPMGYPLHPHTAQHITPGSWRLKVT